MSISTGMSHNQLQDLAQIFATKVENEADDAKDAGSEFVLNMNELDKAFENSMALRDFASNVLGLDLMSEG
jgi:hypothetical protein